MDFNDSYRIKQGAVGEYEVDVIDELFDVAVAHSILRRQLAFHRREIHWLRYDLVVVGHLNKDQY